MKLGSGCCQFCLSPCIRFQEIIYGSIIKKKKKKQHSSLVSLPDCNRFTVENWSEQFVRGVGSFEGRPSVPEVFVSAWCFLLPRLHLLTLLRHSHTHTHTQTPSLSPSLKFPDTVDTQTTSTYGIHQSIVLKDPAEHGINYCNYDASAVFCFCFSLNFTLATSADFVLL